MRRGTSSLGNDVPSEREINRLAARSDEEFWMFEKMDEERRQKENYRSRLMEDHEVPEWAYSKPDNKENETKGLNGGSVMGKRRRKEVVYADTLSDLQWMKAVENGEDISKLSGRGKRRNYLPSETSEASNNSNVVEDEKPTELTENTPLASEGTSEDTYAQTPVPKRIKLEGTSIEKQESHGVGTASWNGQILTWKTHKKKRSSYSIQSSYSDSKGQNSNGRGNGWT